MKRTTKETLDNYVTQNWEPGGFCQAVLENDLMGALGRADMENRSDIFEICQYVYNELPAECHGSRAAVTSWLNRSPEEVKKIGEIWLKLKKKEPQKNG